MKCFIINFNRLTLTKNLADFLSSLNIDVFIVDNNSSYEPLLEFYEQTNYEIIKINKNDGNNVFWNENIYDKLKLNENYIVTDPDLDLSNVPPDFVEILNEGLQRYPNYNKCGLSLQLHDLPKNNMTQEIIEWEKVFWKNKLDNMYFDAAVDTTLALYNKNIQTLTSLRTNYPYTAKHIPWYYTNYDDLPDDEKYYFDNSIIPSKLFYNRINKSESEFRTYDMKSTNIR